MLQTMRKLLQRKLKSPPSINELNSDLFTPEKDERYSSPLEARKKAMDYLARREYGQKELVRKLANAGYDHAVADAAVKQLTADGLQDDRRFVELFIQSRINQGKGPVRVQAELGQKGLPGGLVDQVLDDTEVDWYELASNVKVRKFGSDVPKDYKTKAKQMRFLQQRGFEQSHIQSAVSGADDTF
jgi:regulatory protein